MRICHLLCFVLLISFESPSRILGDETRSRIDSIEFEGNQTFSDEDLWASLRMSPDYLLAIHPYCDDADVSNVIKILLEAGYRNCGFDTPSVTVLMQTEHSPTKVKIEEGKRYRCHALKIVGAKQLDVATLAKRLTEPFATTDMIPNFVTVNGELKTRWLDSDGSATNLKSPVWERDEPVSFGTESYLRKDIQKALQDIGYSGATMAAAIVKNENKLTADLVITLDDEGPRDCIDVLEVKGVEINTREQLLGYLKLVPAQPIDQDRITQLTKRLWDSGRFKKHRLTFSRSALGVRRLLIDVVELPKMPPLSEALSEVALVYLGAQRWLSELHKVEKDLYVEYNFNGLQTRIVSSKEGLIFQFISPSQIIDGIEQPGQTVSLVVDQSQAIVSYSQHDESWICGLADIKGKLVISSAIAAIVEGDRTFTLKFSGYWHSRRFTDELLIDHALSFSPAGWLPLAYRPTAINELKADRLKAIFDTHHLEIDTRDDAIVKWESEDSVTRFEAGIFARMRQEIFDQCQSRTNAYDAKKPISSLVKYILSLSDVTAFMPKLSEDEGDVHDYRPHLLSAIRKLVAAGLIDPMDALVVESRSAQVQDRFNIPMEPPREPSILSHHVLNAMIYTVYYSPQIFSEESWATALVRGTYLYALGKTEHAHRAMKEAWKERKVRPIFYTAVAFLFLAVDAEIGAKYADYALQNLNGENVLSDYQDIKNGPGGKWISQLLTTVLSLSNAELYALEAIAPNELIRDALFNIREHCKPSSSEVGVIVEVTRVLLESFESEHEEP